MPGKPSRDVPVGTERSILKQGGNLELLRERGDETPAPATVSATTVDAA